MLLIGKQIVKSVKVYIDSLIPKPSKLFSKNNLVHGNFDGLKFENFIGMPLC